MTSRFALVFGAVLAVAMAGQAALGAEAPGDTVKLGLESCVTRALDVNTSVLKAEFSLGQAGDAIIGSASRLLPSAGWTSRFSRSELEEPQVLPSGQIITSSKSYSSTFSISEDASAPSVFGLFESFAGRTAAAQNVRSARQNVAYTAKQKYLQVLRTRRLQEVSQQSLDLSNRQLQKAQAMLEVGSGVKSDVLRAQVEVGNSELDLISAKNAVRLAETDLKSFLRIDDSRPLQLEDILEPGETAYTLDAALVEAMQMRPDIRAGAATVKAGRLSVWGQRGYWLPQVSYSWRRGYANLVFPDRAADIWDDSQWQWGLQISLNLWDSFATFSSVRSAKSQLKSAEEDLKQTKLDASLEVKQAYYLVEEAQQRVKVSTETVALAEEELRLAEERYRLGGGTMLEQVDAQVSLSQARTAQVQALYDYLLSQAQLVMAMGRD